MKFRTLAIILLTAAASLTTASGYQKTVITSADQLPRRSHQLTGNVAQILADDAQLQRLSQALLANLKGDLEKLDIQDKATLASYHSTIALLHALLGEPDKALAQVPIMRGLETKPAVRLTTGLFLEVWAKTRLQVRDESSQAFKDTFERNLAAAYAGMPYAEIKEHVETSRAQAAMINPELVIGNVQTMQPMLDATKGLVSEGVVSSLLGVKFILNHRLPLKAQLSRVYTALSEANSASVAKRDTWSAKEVALANADVKAPVVVAIWDSGVDLMALPEANRWVNTNEVVDRQDNDQNGHIDDVYGIGYDRSIGAYTLGPLEDPKGKITSDVARLQRLTKGGIDLQAGIQSKEASEVQQMVSSLKRDEVKTFIEELNFYTAYMHGTHVSGIALAGNPGARILAARMTSDYHQQPPPYTMELARANAEMFRDVVDYFKQHDVRVVNMSWRYSGATIEASLTANGIGRDAGERRALARKMFDIEKSALYEAIRNAPDILFICGSGNENNDADFSEYIPASFDLPNLITIGAVDIEGKRTSFTTSGRSVDFYANGHEIESYVPGGARLRISGTSMASPQVANLAAKLVAIDPELTPSRIVSLIDRGSDTSPEDPALKLINPKKTIALLRGGR